MPQPPQPPRRRRVVSRGEVVRGACHYFLRHGTVDMDALAPALAVSRATLYRVAGSRDALLGDVLWRLADGLLARARRSRRSTGVDGVLEVTRRFTAELRGATPFRHFLRTDPETATRLLTSGVVHRRAVLAQRAILLEAGGVGSAGSPAGLAELDELAYLYVRVVESALYAELLSGRPPDFVRAERAARAVLLHGR
ncbi:QsdR family transcriptional regulator [Streptomyces albus]|uniref:QsdR family transcriptional regulator n=1 Tax=Streptomyces albus TaxID=1888 RepID=UPI0004C55B0E|nr:QsdR family transcriptional regulator [Streptomyces albus]